MKIYTAGIITGLDFDTVVNYFQDTHDVLAGYGYTVFFPFTAKAYLKGKKEFKAEGEPEFALSTGHALTCRDRWMVKQADVIYVNLLGATRVSIGCIMELAWAYDNAKHTVVAMEGDNLHHHGFVHEAAHVIFQKHEEALDYLRKLIGGHL